jgi:hypothetical protein
VIFLFFKKKRFLYIILNLTVPIYEQPPLTSKESPLTGSQRQRGMYMNAGSRDAGVDPDWDFKERRWKGYDKQKKSANQD